MGMGMESGTCARRATSVRCEAYGPSGVPNGPAIATAGSPNIVSLPSAAAVIKERLLFFQPVFQTSCRLFFVTTRPVTRPVTEQIQTEQFFISFELSTLCISTNCL